MRIYLCGGRSLLSFPPGPPETLNTYSHPQPVILVLRGCYHIFVVPSASRNIQAKETRFWIPSKRASNSQTLYTASLNIPTCPYEYKAPCQVLFEAALDALTRVRGELPGYIRLQDNITPSASSGCDSPLRCNIE